MRLMSFVDPTGRSSYGVVDGDVVSDLADHRGLPPCLRDLLKTAQWQQWLTEVAETAPKRGLAGVEFLPVIPDPTKIICVGINYASHVKETGRDMPSKPMIFTRFASSQTGHRQPLLQPAVSDKFDFEGELAVIIGTAGRYLSRAEGLRAVAGYSCYNDGSVRDWQRHSVQWAPGKNFPRTGAFGPWMVTAEAMGPIGPQRIVTRLNGEVMQDGRLDDLIFDVGSLVSYASYFAELEPGDVILTGTTGGVGAFREVPIWLKAGDLVEVEIDGIGILSNEVVRDAVRPETDNWA